MRATAFIGLIAISACASGNSSPGSSAAGTQAIVRGSDIRSAPSNPDHVTLIESSVAPVWRALPAVYDSLGIPLTVMDFKQHLIGNQGMKIRQTLGKVALSKYIDCGNGQIIPSADSYDIFLSVVTHVRPNEPVGSDLVTTMSAAARPLNVSQEYSQCSSKGELEKKIAELVKAAVRH